MKRAHFNVHKKRQKYQAREDEKRRHILSLLYSSCYLLLILHEVNCTQKDEHLHHIVTLWCSKFCRLPTFFIAHTRRWIALRRPSHTIGSLSFYAFLKIHIWSFHLTSWISFFLLLFFFFLSPLLPQLLCRYWRYPFFPTTLYPFIRSLILFHLNFWWIIPSQHDT